MLKLQRGMTLIELIAAIVLMAVAMLALTTVFKVSNTGSSDAKRRTEALALAHGAMTEILATPFATLPACGANESWSLHGGTVPGYAATLAVNCADWSGIPADSAKRLRLTVNILAADDHGILDSVVVDGYRTNYSSASAVTRTN
jgi:prepilin-type N-terminal cleavage/methylation domain-containing protein